MKVDYVQFLRGLHVQPDELTGKVWMKPEIARAIAMELESARKQLEIAWKEREVALRFVRKEMESRIAVVEGDTRIDRYSDGTYHIENPSGHAQFAANDFDSAWACFVRNAIPHPAPQQPAPQPPAPAVDAAPVGDGIPRTPLGWAKLWLEQSDTHLEAMEYSAAAAVALTNQALSSVIKAVEEHKSISERSSDALLRDVQALMQKGEQ